MAWVVCPLSLIRISIPTTWSREVPVWDLRASATRRLARWRRVWAVAAPCPMDHCLVSKKQPHRLQPCSEPATTRPIDAPTHTPNRHTPTYRSSQWLFRTTHQECSRCRKSTSSLWIYSHSTDRISSVGRTPSDTHCRSTTAS